MPSIGINLMGTPLYHRIQHSFPLFESLTVLSDHYIMTDLIILTLFMGSYIFQNIYNLSKIILYNILYVYVISVLSGDFMENNQMVRMKDFVSSTEVQHVPNTWRTNPSMSQISSNKA